ncbi:MAG: aldehyde ferredoxin oxidoreductase C-terminal domain-containing protein, partial [Actinobacteria bacterium]|nr:aldehyde ferredoxin oxidoreductase C-terminal domain-containing protein [Actinomycetota bacterium]
GLPIFMLLGDVPIKNWNLGVWDEGAEELSGMNMSETILINKKACFGCSIPCKRVVKVSEGKYKIEKGPGPEYETCASFGTLCFIGDLKAVAKINELCNRYGMDTISCGGAIAFAIECYEKGIIGKSDTDGLKLKWGDGEAVLNLVKMIAKRDKGIGNVLADGSKKASKKIGKDSEKFLVEVKGLEVPMHDPRAFHGLGLEYAISNRGACHVNSYQMFVELGQAFYPEIGLEGPYEGMDSTGKARIVSITQNLGSILNSANICSLLGISFSVTDILNSLNYSTGFDYTLEDMMKIGERIWYLKRGINNLLGIKREDDRLPEKILTPVTEGAAAGLVPDIKLMLNEFYKIRKINKEGKPKREKLKELGLKDLADKIYKR